MITSIRPIVLDRLVQAIADITSDLTTCPKEVKVDTNEKKKTCETGVGALRLIRFSSVFWTYLRHTSRKLHLKVLSSRHRGEELGSIYLKPWKENR